MFTSHSTVDCCLAAIATVVHNRHIAYSLHVTILSSYTNAFLYIILHSLDPKLVKMTVGCGKVIQIQKHIYSTSEAFQKYVHTHI
jgi:hypothetical protein